MSDALRRMLPSALTLAGLACGGLALTHAAPAGPGALSLVLLAVLLDQLDGPLARRLGVSSAFGASLDAVSDVVIYLLVPMHLMVEAGALLPGLVYLLAASVRMARDLSTDAKDITLGAPALVFFILHVLGGVPSALGAAGFGLLAGGLLLSPVRLSPRGPSRIGLTLVGPVALVVSLSRTLMGGG